MVRSTSGGRAHVDARGLDLQIPMNNDAVELRDRVPGMKARPGRCDVKLGLDVVEAKPLFTNRLD